MSGDAGRALALARRRIALGVLGTDEGDAHLGEVRLLPHQRDAVRRLGSMLRDDGGAVLADATGLGKTFVALALARAHHAPVVVAPAALRATWADAACRAGLTIPFISVERLSRAPIAELAPDLVVVDEAHHCRNAATRRWRHLAQLARDAAVLLLSATPLHNAPEDLRALLALFLGSRARGLDAAALARHVVRRTIADVALPEPLPRASDPVELPLRADARVLAQLLALPPPVPPAGGGDGGALVALGLARLWCSSDGALRAALRRRLQRAAALEDALAAGGYPDATALRGWLAGDDAVQLALPLGEQVIAVPHELLEAVRQHANGVRAVLHGPLATSGRDAARARQLRELRRRHAGAKIVVFSQFADSIAALRRELAREPGVAALTRRGAAVAGGALSRAEALARFAPVAAGRAPPRSAERIELLLATDLLSEGVNLQDAQVVVHLDLPWTPARLEQRLGRVRRLGSRHDEVFSYVCRPPVSGERLLRLEQRLRRKLRDAARHVGTAGTILPRLQVAAGRTSSAPPEADAAVRHVLARWRAMDVDACHSPAADDAPLVAAVRAARAGFVALARTGGEPRLVAGSRGAVRDHPSAVLRALRAAEGEPAPVDARLAERAIVRVRAWLASERGRSLLAPAAGGGATRRRLLTRISQVAHRAPRHRRRAVSALVTAARRAAEVHAGAGAERELAELVGASLDDEAWLRAVAAFADARAARTASAGGDGAARLEVLVLLVGARRVDAAGAPEGAPTRPPG
ncbi:MAG TPA: DEAD/DEAH box helicase [Gemmatimonadaceae bacterium]|nr:DEAD/DEAH box helicase [Gemmatimonadaceae bacterium]